MKQRRWGRIINIAAAHGLVASPFKSAYVAAKHGLIGLGKTVAMEVAEHGIPPENVVRDVLLLHQARKELVTLEELAALAVFLSADAAASMTAAALAMDNGWTRH